LRERAGEGGCKCTLTASIHSPLHTQPLSTYLEHIPTIIQTNNLKCIKCSDSNLKNIGPEWTSRKQEFNRIFEENAWGSPESKSGTGSELIYTKRARHFLSTTFKTFNIKSFLDSPCGDCNWQPKISGFKKIHYTGADIVSQVIIQNGRKYRHHKNMRFINLDLAIDEIPKFYDLVLTRDALQHLSIADGLAIIKSIEKSGAKYLVTNFQNASLGNYDIPAGQWYPIDVTMPPFNFTPPLMYITDGIDSPVNGAENWKMMGVWKLPVLGKGTGEKFVVDPEPAKLDIIVVDESLHLDNLDGSEQKDTLGKTEEKSAEKKASRRK
jgi:hypothetical protein